MAQIQLKVLTIGTSPAETMQVEETLQQLDRLDEFRYVSLEQVLRAQPNWEAWDMIIARYQPQKEANLLLVLAGVLRGGSPPVVLLVDTFDAPLVMHWLGLGAFRVLPVDQCDTLLESCLPAVQAESPIDHGSLHVRMQDPQAAGEGQQAASALKSFAQFFRSSPVGISIQRLADGVCLECNDRFAQMLEWPREQLIGRVVLELQIPREMLEQLRASASSETQSTAEYVAGLQFERKYFTRTHQLRHIQVYLENVDWNGETSILALVQDVTEKEQAKEKVRRLNEELERLVVIRTGALHAANRELAAEIGLRKGLEDYSNQLTQIIGETPDVVAIFAPNGAMQFFNKAGRALFGLDEIEPVDHLNLISLYPENLREWIQQEVQPHVLAHDIWHGEAAFLLNNAEQIPLSQVMVCKRNEAGEVQYFATISRDISDFKRVEQELRQSRERYRTLAESAHDFIFMVSKDGLMEYANEYVCQSLGIDPNQVAGVPISEFFPKDFAANHLQVFYDVHQIDRPMYTEGPFPIHGQNVWLGTWLVPIHQEDGSLVSVLGISRDITAQKKTDEDLQQALQDERKLGEMRTNFFSMTSHQFRTPLSSILLSVELLQRYSAKWDDQKRSEQLDRIREAAKRLNGMLEDILVIGRVEAGRYVCSPKEFDLLDLCQKTIQEIAINDRNEHEILFQHEVNLLPVYQDPDVMHRVIDNLMTNAVKYSPKGSQVTIAVGVDGRNVQMTVTDQGIGIPERDIEHLFQPFQRGSNVANFPGTGIGLTIIQKSVELMNGIIHLDSKEGQGTTFMVRFPVRYESNADRVLV